MRILSKFMTPGHVKSYKNERIQLSALWIAITRKDPFQNINELNFTTKILRFWPYRTTVNVYGYWATLKWQCHAIQVQEYKSPPLPQTCYKIKSRAEDMSACVPNLAPAAVVLNAVNGQGDHLYTSLLELIADLGCTGQLRGADRSEVPRMGEQNTPAAEEKTRCRNVLGNEEKTKLQQKFQN